MNTVINEDTRFGFNFGNAIIERICTMPNGSVVIGMFTDRYREGKKGMIEIRITKTGIVRIFSDEGEWKLWKKSS